MLTGKFHFIRLYNVSVSSSENQITRTDGLDNIDGNHTCNEIVTKNYEDENYNFCDSRESVHVNHRKPLLSLPSSISKHGEPSLSNLSLILVATGHVFKIALSALPSILVVCSLGYAYSRLPWTNNVKADATEDNYTGNYIINNYFNRWTLFWFDDVGRTV